MSQTREQNTNNMNEDQLAVLIPILVPIGAFILAYGINKQETDVKKLMIENGIDPTQTPKFGGGALKFGGLLIGGGLGLLLAKITTEIITINNPEELYFGFIITLGGFGLVKAHNLARKQYKEDNPL